MTCEWIALERNFDVTFIMFFPVYGIFWLSKILRDKFSPSTFVKALPAGAYRLFSFVLVSCLTSILVRNTTPPVFKLSFNEFRKALLKSSPFIEAIAKFIANEIPVAYADDMIPVAASYFRESMLPAFVRFTACL